MTTACIIVQWTQDTHSKSENKACYNAVKMGRLQTTWGKAENDHTEKMKASSKLQEHAGPVWMVWDGIINSDNMLTPVAETGSISIKIRAWCCQTRMNTVSRITCPNRLPAPFLPAMQVVSCDHYPHFILCANCSITFKRAENNLKSSSIAERQNKYI